MINVNTSGVVLDMIRSKFKKFDTSKHHRFSINKGMLDRVNSANTFSSAITFPLVELKTIQPILVGNDVLIPSVVVPDVFRSNQIQIDHVLEVDLPSRYIRYCVWLKDSTSTLNQLEDKYGIYPVLMYMDIKNREFTQDTMYLLYGISYELATTTDREEYKKGLKEFYSNAAELAKNTTLSDVMRSLVAL